ncbi:MAG TPA: hypothetical protein VGW14_10600, partial [Thermoleophilaceae bacterium]|nr:hypothetical protein [Thermoleophilaceae bacterium]
MSATVYRPDRRTEADALRELSAIAAATPLPASLLPPDTGEPGPRTWGELLFDGERLHDPGEPSQALLAGLAQAQATL